MLSLLYGPTLTSVHDYQKTIALIMWTFVSKVMSQLFNMLSFSVLVTQSCPALCDPMDYSPPGSSDHGILQARLLEWVVLPFSRGSSPPRDTTRVSPVVGGFFTIWATGEATREQANLQREAGQGQRWISNCVSLTPCSMTPANIDGCALPGGVKRTTAGRLDSSHTCTSLCMPRGGAVVHYTPY